MNETVIHPKVSVLIPVYNVEKYVGRCIDSVLHQTMQKGVEVIIVNDCTPDRSMEIIFEALRAYENEVPAEKRMSVRVVHHDTNRGQAAVRNTAISYATGDYTIHVDSDDYLEPDMLEKMYAKAVEEDADIVIADHWDVLNEKKVNEYRKVPPFNDIRQFRSKVIQERCSSVWDKLIRRSLYADNGIRWTEGKDMREDHMVMVPLCFYAQKIVYIPHAFYYYVKFNTDSITHKSTEREKNGCLFAAESLKSFIASHYIEGYEDDVNFFLLKMKCSCIIHSSRKEVDKYLHLYPEANRSRKYFIQAAPSLSLKVQYFLASYGYVKLLRSFLWFKNYVKKAL